MTDLARRTTFQVRLRSRRSLAFCALLGAAVMAALDEIVFHQILAWHHFYDRSTLPVGLLSDGLLRTAELLGLIAASSCMRICAAAAP